MDATYARKTWRSSQAKPNLSAWGLFLLLVGTVFVPPELFSILTVFFLLVAIGASSLRIPRDVVRLVLPLFAIVLVGLLGVQEHPFYEVAKDIWYVGKPIILLMLGYMLMLRIRDLQMLIEIVLVASVVAACWHLSAFVLNPNLIQGAIPAIRKVAGSGYFLVALAMPLAISVWRQRATPVRLRKITLGVVIVVCGLSLAMSFSRTYWLSMAILTVAVLGVFAGKLSAKRTLMLSLAVLSVSAVILAIVGIESNQLESRLNVFGRIAHSMEEITISDYATEGEINQNWRGYESYKAISTFAQGSAIEQVSGQGFGGLIDLGLHIQLGENTYRQIPILHNGYLYILVKTGVVGLLAYAWFLRRLLARARLLASEQHPEEMIFAGRILAGLVWTFVLTTIVIAGIFNKEALTAATLIAGALCAVQERGSNLCVHTS